MSNEAADKCLRVSVVASVGWLLRRPEERGWNTDSRPVERAKTQSELRELLTYFLRLGTLGFGGPIVLAGHMHKAGLAEAMELGATRQSRVQFTWRML